MPRATNSGWFGNGQMLKTLSLKRRAKSYASQSPKIAPRTAESQITQ